MNIGNPENNLIKQMLWRVLPVSAALLVITGCSSAMSHSGATDHRYYPGTQASYQLLNNDNTGWTLKPLIILDIPFSFILDTVLLPWDALHHNLSIKSRIENTPQSDKAKEIAPNSN